MLTRGRRRVEVAAELQQAGRGRSRRGRRAQLTRCGAHHLIS